MLHGSENLVLVFQDNAVYMLVRGVDQCLGFFGGPLEYELAGQSCGRRRLHQIASLSLNLLRVLGRPDLIDEIPLVYGMCYDGCRLRYEYDSSKIRILELKPRKSTEAWPYHDYPAILPYCPLALGERRNDRVQRDRVRDNRRDLREQPGGSGHHEAGGALAVHQRLEPVAARAF